MQEALLNILPGVLAQLMPNLVLAVPIQASTSDCGEGAELVYRTEEGSRDDTQVSGAISHHMQAITGKGLADYDLSDDEDGALMYTLSMEEVRKVAQQQYINFSAMFQRHQKNFYSGKKTNQDRTLK